MAAVAFGITVIGFIFGAFWRMWGLIKEAGEKGDRAQRDLAAHKLEIAQNYVTKAGMHEQTAQLLRAIESIGNRIDTISERIDRAFERSQTSR
ncbi:hypothetical protein [Mesorhizobium sp. M00.F.Ca.ET.217.01.1.1]|uniref:hypothetical protein n=1 Tax=Mesorhizobium sp. M00.F.Ca.ET.217.01.1.1 TaxID=2500529 RepID=UPI001FE20F14|nr:hypothetical protein [Mesorhizobium sp. M00.F.Ca.ET.217.01.1.1]